MGLLGVGMPSPKHARPRKNDRERERDREPQKDTGKSSLQEACKGFLQDRLTEQQERVESVKKAQHRAEEDAMMELIHGPDWRDKAP